MTGRLYGSWSRNLRKSQRRTLEHGELTDRNRLRQRTDDRGSGSAGRWSRPNLAASRTSSQSLGARSCEVIDASPHQHFCRCARRRRVHCGLVGQSGGAFLPNGSDSPLDSELEHTSPFSMGGWKCAFLGNPCGSCLPVPRTVGPRHRAGREFAQGGGAAECVDGPQTLPENFSGPRADFSIHVGHGQN